MARASSDQTDFHVDPCDANTLSFVDEQRECPRVTGDRGRLVSVLVAPGQLSSCLTVALPLPIHVILWQPRCFCRKEMTCYLLQNRNPYKLFLFSFGTAVVYPSRQNIRRRQLAVGRQGRTIGVASPYSGVHEQRRADSGQRGNLRNFMSRWKKCL